MNTAASTSTARRRTASRAPAIPGRAQRRRLPRLTLGRVTFLIVLTTLVIEALLGLRIWVQLSGNQLQVNGLRTLYDASTVLVSPFRGLETANGQRTDVLEFATFIAVEAYLLLAVILFGLALLIRMAARTVTVRFERDAVSVTRRAPQTTA